MIQETQKESDSVAEPEAKKGIEKNTEEKVAKSLRYSIFDGFFYSVMVGFGESFLNAFAIFLNATTGQISLLGSLPQAMGSLSQLLSHSLMRWLRSRKRIVLFGVLVSALMYLPIMLSFFLGKSTIGFLLAAVCIYWVSSTIIGPAWNSWMGDLVDKNQRGIYFGTRNRIAGFATFFSFIIAGYLLQRFAEDATKQYAGYVLIFSIALLARLLSYLYISRKYEPEFVEVPGSHFTFLQFVKKAPTNNYGRFVIYHAFMNFAVYLSAPFFTAYMLKDLNLNYLHYTGLQAAAILMKNLSMPIWGKALDRFGAKKVLTLAGFTMPVVPILWALFSNYWVLIGAQLFSGLVWAAFELAAFTFIFDITTPQKRALCVAYYNVLNGAAMLTGALIGGYIVTRVPEGMFFSKFLVVFALSGIFRYASSFIFLPKIKEVRTVEHIHYHTLFLNVLTTIPSTAGIINPIHELEKIPKIPVMMVKEISDIIGELTETMRDSASKRNEKRLRRRSK